MANELTKIDSHPIAAQVQNEPINLLQLAVERGASVDTIERMMAVRRELKAEKAKEEFDRSMAEFQSRCPTIEKTKFGAKKAYKYAPIEEISEKTKQLRLELGFSYSLTAVTESEWVTATITVKHNNGHFERSEFKTPIDKANPMMTMPQRYTGAMTTAKRQAFCNAFGILTGDEDEDAHPPPETPQGPRTQAPTKLPTPPDDILKRRLVDLTKAVHNAVGYKLTPAQMNQIENHLFERGIIGEAETLPQIKGDRLAEVVAKLEGK